MPVNNQCTLRFAAKHIRAGVHRMLQYLDNSVVCRQLPVDPHTRNTVTHDGETCLRLYGPQQDLASTTELSELGKHETDRATYPLARVHLYLPQFVPAIARWQGETQFAATSLRIARGQSALP